MSERKLLKHLSRSWNGDEVPGAQAAVNLLFLGPILRERCQSPEWTDLSMGEESEFRHSSSVVPVP